MATRTVKKATVLKDGTVLDDQTLERVVADVEDAVLSVQGKTTYPRKGRPSLSGRSAESPHVGFRVSAELRNEAETVARKRGLTVSALAREALAAYVKKAG